eukprot:1161907-Pelagomonas_calceolata.AAC.4
MMSSNKHPDHKSTTCVWVPVVRREQSGQSRQCRPQAPATHKLDVHARHDDSKCDNDNRGMKL